MEIFQDVPRNVDHSLDNFKHEDTRIDLNTNSTNWNKKTLLPLFNRLDIVHFNVDTCEYVLKMTMKQEQAWAQSI
jgi:hypothetical protein